MAEERFSKRYGFEEIEPAEITSRYEAPDGLRNVVPILAKEVGMTPKPQRKIVCQVLRKRPDPNNWSEYPNIAEEVADHLDNCDWYKVYDIIEALYKEMYPQQAQKFEEEINLFLLREGIGWKMEDGIISIRGSEAFEDAVEKADSILSEANRPTARNEIKQSLSDLSRRPEPDITGAIQHALAALECVARDVSGKTDTLGQLAKRDDIFPKPLNIAVEKVWGFSSETGRHLLEGDDPDEDEAELLVGLSSVLVSYIIKKVDE
jgi:hypothetical protein